MTYTADNGQGGGTTITAENAQLALVPLFLEAVTLQGRVNNSAPDTDGWGDGVLSRDKQINVAFADGKGVPPFKVQQVGQVNTVTKSDFSVPVMEGLYGYC